MNFNLTVKAIILYLIFAPIVGGILSGIDRRLTARLQGRFGPPILQPFYDVLKLLSKENLVVNRFQSSFIYCHLLFMIITGAIFFAGGDILLVIFALILAGIFLVLGAYSANSPYSKIGAERELLQMMAYEPMLILMAVGFYLVSGSFNISDILSVKPMPFIPLIGMFLGYIYMLTIKFRKSPFDLSMSHHGYQDLAKGVTTEFSGPVLALIEIAHWYENIFLLGLVFLFFSGSPVLGIIVVIIVYLFEIFIDSNFARVKWEWALNTSWIVTLVAGFFNLIVLYLI